MAASQQVQQRSKLLSYVLRHRPDSIGLTLDAQGWVDVAELLRCLADAGKAMSRDDLLVVVRDNDKQRFSLNADGNRIRAAQGHSVTIDLALPDREPPAVLFHGTARRHLPAILAEGLRPRTRQHVHLSADTETAWRVGRRHGEPVLLQVNAQAMHVQGFRFTRSDNGVWLTESVPTAFLTQLAEPADRA
ncbi:MAG: RNA 2'-phosphotransferase [Lysobacterales bacterium]